MLSGVRWQLQWRQIHHVATAVQIVHGIIMRIFLCAFLLALFPVAVVVVRNVVVSHLKLLLLHLQVLHLLLILLKLEVITVCVCVVVFIIFIIIRVPIIVHSHTSETYVRVVIHTSFVEISTLLAGTVPTSVAVVIVVVILSLIHI